ncbi:MAG: hypothetical protein R3B54_14280 [Bdellovibrionota bacterium]
MDDYENFPDAELATKFFDYAGTALAYFSKVLAESNSYCPFILGPKTYNASESPLVHLVGVVIPGCERGWELPSGSIPGVLTYGPYEGLSVGWARADFYLGVQVETDDPTENVGTIDIRANPPDGE